MTNENFDKNYVAQYHANAEHLAQHGMYDPAEEHDACGVGFVAAINGEASRGIVDAALGALAALGHRGAVDADGKTGDGAGIHIQIPQDFFTIICIAFCKPPQATVPVKISPSVWCFCRAPIWMRRNAVAA